MQKQTQVEISPSQSQNNQPQNLPYQAADLILYYLEQIGVEYVFGIPGGGIEPLYNALARSQRRDGPRSVVARHETGAAFMADGYARETGKLGVCCATTGPGATNMLTGVASAYLDHTPLLAITAQTSIKNFGRGAVQESSCTGINTVAIYQHCTVYNSLVSHIDQLERKLLAAFTAALQPPYGPAHLSIPIDILRDTISISPNINLSSLITPSNAVDEKEVEYLHHTLCKARNTVFVLGAGAKRAAPNILELASLIDAQVVTLPDGKGLVSAYHPQYRGIYGLAGHASARSVLHDKATDTVLAVGTQLDEQATNGWESTALLGKKMVYIDSTPLYFARSPIARQHFSGNISEMFSHLLKRFHRIQGRAKNNDTCLQSQPQVQAQHQSVLVPFDRRSQRQRRNPTAKIAAGISYLHLKERRYAADRRVNAANPPAIRRFTLKDEDKYLSQAGPIKPQRLMYDLARLFPPETRYFADIGNSFLWAIHYLHPFVPSHMHLNPEPVRLGMGLASMGWAIGAAVGTAMAVRNTPVVCISGDGSMLMSGQEITTAVLEKLPVIFVVLNDAALGTVKHGQKMAKAEPIGYELPRIDFVAYAQAMGATGYKIASPQDLMDMDIASLCTQAGPTVLDVHIDPDELPPLEQRIKMLEAERNP